MQRLTWSGVALHAGRLPGYSASHCCIRMPYGFAKQLFEQTSNGMTIVVSDEEQFPSTVANPLAPLGHGDGPCRQLNAKRLRIPLDSGDRRMEALGPGAMSSRPTSPPATGAT